MASIGALSKELILHNTSLASGLQVINELMPDA